MFPPFMKFPRTMAFFVPDYIFQSNKFELIFDWFFDRDEEWEKHCDKERKHNLGEVEGLIVDDFSWYFNLLFNHNDNVRDINKMSKKEPVSVRGIEKKNGNILHAKENTLEQKIISKPRSFELMYR